MHNFKNLNIWIKSMELVSENYNITNSFPEMERYGLANQMNRSAVSIPSNIAEGSSKGSDKHFNQYLETSLGSAFEWETQLTIAYKQNYIEEDVFKTSEEKIIQIQRMISGFQKGLKKD
ncbi:MAG: four helix bundle protein [Flavobacteriaceae bacterium]|nr:four helix bundle protein [Flavobacteriaceae bacterium]